MRLSSVIIIFGTLIPAVFAATPVKLACLLNKGTTEQCYVRTIERSGCPNYRGIMEECETPGYITYQCSVCSFEDSENTMFAEGKKSITTWCNGFKGNVEVYNNTIKPCP
ncbi:hypothetical protein INT47_011265 [Mucor saturninus]|uniref:Uncharacterized protein n=1 Tax=Mucor saturninus TaxID=64648 RepID=A0A8H7RL22_9FUNG|nr:hypothetical protein INT47_011265 [Mucor saturninus]